MKLVLNDRPLELTQRGKGYAVSVGGQSLEVEVLRAADGWLELLVDGRRVRAYVSAEQEKRWVTVGGRTSLLTRASGATGSRAAHPHAADLTAPMPGQVRAVNVSQGDPVRKGQTLVVVEAMKMELRVQSPRDGVVGRVYVSPGESVEREQVLIEVDEPRS
jgi:biotin carboxyl carrier protein